MIRDASQKAIETLRDFLKIESAGGLGIDKPLLLWINDALMAFFFMLVGLELKREVLEGQLSRPDQVVLPALAAVGGVLHQQPYNGLSTAVWNPSATTGPFPPPRTLQRQDLMDCGQRYARLNNTIKSPRRVQRLA